jgi:hypothetical protein
MKIFYTGFILLLLAFSCVGKSGKTAKTVTEYPNKNEQDRMLEDGILRKEYASEILLANSIINKLEEYYSQNNDYPEPVGFIYEDLEKEITGKSGKNFYYTWLKSHYVLTYELPDGTGLLYFSKTKLWTISENLP